MAFDIQAKSYLKALKDKLTDDQWTAFLKLTNTQKKAQIIAVIDQNISDIDTALLNLENEKILREASLNSDKSKLLDIKAQVNIEL